MTKANALELQKQIEHLCKEKGLWYETTQENRPELGKIVITIALKIEEDK